MGTGAVLEKQDTVLVPISGKTQYICYCLVQCVCVWGGGGGGDDKTWRREICLRFD